MNNRIHPKRVALVTGASAGIGAAAAIALARLGFAPVLAVRRPEAAQATQQEAQTWGVPCRIERCDVSDVEQVRAAMEATVQTWGRIDVVVNNAAQIDPIARIEDSDADAWAAAIATNLVGPYNVARAALPELVRNRGAVINISSRASRVAREGWSPYCSAKAGLAMFTRCLALETAEQGVHVYGVDPGLTDTGMQERIRESGINEISRLPREQLGPPERAAARVAWLADTRPQALHGEETSVNDEQQLDAAMRHARRANAST